MSSQIDLIEWEKLGPEQMAASIHEFILHDFEKLIQLLYRLDVNELKLKKILASHPNEDAGKLITALVIERQLEKIRSKETYRPNENIPEEERW